VPRTGEQIGVEDNADHWTLKRRESQRPSRELEEMLMAITLKISKDRFERREWETSREYAEAKFEEKDNAYLDVNKTEADMVDRELQEERLQDAQPAAPEDMSQEYFARVGQRTIDTSREAGEASEYSSILLEGLERPSDDAFGFERPTVSADDERSARLLRLSIRNTLSRLDELLMALHNVRQTCLYYASEHTESQTDFEGGDGSSDESSKSDRSRPPPATFSSEKPPEHGAKRSRPGRPPKTLQMPADSNRDPLESAQPEKTETRGRRRKLHVPLEGESYEEMLIRIARLQKKKMPFTSGPTGYNSSSPTKSARGDSRKRGTSAQARDKRSTRLGLRDWSEIVGTAALVGFSPEVIARTTQRCANLFGEGMKMISLVEHPISDNEDQIKSYFPEEIPDMDNLDNYITTRSESDDQRPKIGRRPPRGRSRPRKRESEMAVTESEEGKTSSGVDAAHFCPDPECLRHKHGFSKRRYLTKHLKEVHKLDKKGLQEIEQDSQDEMEGGVHVDGFMKLIKRRAGWRAVDKVQRRRKSRGRVKTEDPEEMEITSVHSANEWDKSEDDMDEALDSD
jgi:hypothetical protein